MESYPVLAAKIHDFFKESEYVLDKVRFEYLKGRYTGRGILTWNPEKGFHLEALVTRSGPPIPSMSFGGLRQIRKSDRTTIRMKPRNYNGWVLASNIILIERWDLINENRLAINIDSLLFSRPIDYNSGSHFTGSSLYFGIGERPILPDSTKIETSISEDLSRVQYSRGGISIDKSKCQRVSGLRVRKNYLELHLSLDPSYWTRSESWIWPKAAADALSLLTGRSIQLVCREINRGKYVYAEIRRPHNVTSLDFLSLMPESAFLDKTEFGRLVKFFTKNTIKASVCRSILQQMFEAARQKSRQATELLLATILEAALRTIQNKPFCYGKRNTWKAEESLKEFRREYLSDDWIQWCDKAIKAWKRLRHRNAHPDWLYSERNLMSDERIAKALEDMIFLAKFYGYMILALSGERGIQPKFPQKSFR